MLKELSIHNYKSIRNVNLVRLPNLGVFVGENAAGKSNFADSLDFLSIVFKNGLSSAVRAKGGYENICFRRAKRSKAGLSFHIRIEAREEPEKRSRKKERLNFILDYDFTFAAPSQAIISGYEVISEKIRVTVGQQGNAHELLLNIERRKNKPTQFRPGPKLRKNDRWEIVLDVVDYYVHKVPVLEDELLLTGLTGRFSGLPPFHLLIKALSNCGVYQISPHIARGFGIPERSPELGRHGENLPAAVNYLERFQSKAFNELLEHVNHTVPTIEGLSTDYVETKELGLFFKEKGVARRWFSQDVSDGTIQTVSIFLPLVDPRKEVVFIEEPENSLHPWILRHFMDSCKQHAVDKQIFITTQSVVAVNEIPLESLYIVGRYRGESNIVRCIDVNPELRQVVIKELLGLGDYWDSGGIAGVPIDIE